MAKPQSRSALGGMKDRKNLVSEVMQPERESSTTKGLRDTDRRVSAVMLKEDYKILKAYAFKEDLSFRDVMVAATHEFIENHVDIEEVKPFIKDK